MSNTFLGVTIVLLALAFLALFLTSTLRVIKALVSAVWAGRAGLDPQVRQGRLRLAAIACLLGAFTAIAILVEQGIDVFGGLGALLLVAVSGSLLIFGFRLFQRAKRIEAPSATTVLSDDKRAPVLYLRSFEDDPKVAQRFGIAGFKLNNEEEDIADIVGKLGPFVAIGRPGEMLPYTGAARIYVGEGDWHARVRKLLSDARLVILRAGDTPGLWWEVEESAKAVNPERLIILVPLKEREYGEFCRKAQNYLPCQLPEYSGRRIPATTLRGVLLFDADWTVHFLPVQETYFGYYGRVLLTFPLFTPFLLLNNALLRKQSHTRRVLEKTFRPILQRSFPGSETPESEPIPIVELHRAHEFQPNSLRLPEVDSRPQKIKIHPRKIKMR